jgi:hypothetical protein
VAVERVDTAIQASSAATIRNDEARRLEIPGRSKMGKAELKRAVARHR